MRLKGSRISVLDTMKGSVRTDGEEVRGVVLIKASVCLALPRSEQGGGPGVWRTHTAVLSASY